MPKTQAKKDAEIELRKIKAQSKAAKAEAKAVAAKKKAKAAKREEDQGRKGKFRASKGVLITTSDTPKDPELAKALAAESSKGLIPPHRHEVHLKKETITVVVTLHNVPPQKIDADATTDSMLVVTTPNHTKKFCLEFEFPHGMKVDSATGDYTFENGELTCVFPVREMPVEVQRLWTQRLDSVRTGQRARFDVDKEGELVVRRRKTTLELKEAKAKAAVKKAEKAEKKGKDEKPAPGKKTAAPVPAVKSTANVSKPNPAKPGPGQKDDKAAMLRIAKESAAKVKDTLQQRLEIARAAHERRLQRAHVSHAKKDVKSDRLTDAFSRVLAEKRAALEARRERLAPAPAKASSPGKNSKSVRFSV